MRSLGWVGVRSENGGGKESAFLKLELEEVC
jgi:hypothetical protein